MNTIEYGYGHTKESATLVRNKLKKNLSEYNLKINVKKADSGYGGPRVKITTNDISYDKSYQYIINSADGSIGDGPGRLVEAPVSSFPQGRPHYTARLITPDKLIELDNYIQSLLNEYGRSNDDVMTDYFDNTTPLFYGVKYEIA